MTVPRIHPLLQQTWDAPTATIGDKIAARLVAAETAQALRVVRADIADARALRLIGLWDALSLRLVYAARVLDLAAQQWARGWARGRGRRARP